MARDITPILARLARPRNLDLAALLAVAPGEGGLVNREGDIGDLAGGGSYGPFQLYAQGALPSRYRGRPKLADQWAWSPQGIAYALDQMTKVGASGLRGADAIRNIITRFERPANPGKSIAAALARLGTGGGGANRSQIPSPSFGQPLARQGNGSTAARQALLSGLASGQDIFDIIPQMVAARQASTPLGGSVSPPNVLGGLRMTPGMPRLSAGTQGLTLRGPINELIHDPQGSIFDGVRKTGAYGGHGGHVHFADTNPQDVLAAIKLAQRLGLAVRENPYVDPVDPVHTEGSHHYKLFPGLFDGRRLGEAIDVSGPEAKRRRFFALLAAAAR